MARRRVDVFSLSFLDAMTCGFGAVVLFFMIINASVGLRSGRLTNDLSGEVDRLEVEVLDKYKRLVELRNALREAESETETARGLSRRVIESIEEIQVELATNEETNLARREHLNRLQSDLKTLEDEARRLAALAPSDETPGDRVRAFVGDGDRQYLTGLKVGGERILLLVDASASMLDETLVNVIVRRNLPDEQKIRAEKWQQAVSTVDWLTTQLPRDSYFQIVTFNESAQALIESSDGEWLPAGERSTLDQAVANLRGTVPQKGTSLHHAFAAIKTLRPRPDNVILITDGLPTRGASPPRGKTVSGKQRMKLMTRALKELPTGFPVNVILLPMEGDPMAASVFWKLALATGGSFLAPSKDWP